PAGSAAGQQPLPTGSNWSAELGLHAAVLPQRLPHRQENADPLTCACDDQGPRVKGERPPGPGGESVRAPASLSAMDDERATVLVIEDDAAERTFLADNLTADGYDLL